MTENTQPCVICRELETEWWHLGFLSEAEFRGITQEERERLCDEARIKFRNHKRICNVHRVWIGGRDEVDTLFVLRA